ncbi:MAG: glycine--tRNA ligase [bacterium]
MSDTKLTLEKIVAFTKSRGFVYPSSEIYGGFAAVYDYGHYGKLLKDNIQRQWEKSMIQIRDDVYALDSGIFMHPMTWKASGHIDGFNDVLVEDKVTHKRFRADHLVEEFYDKKGTKVDMDKKTPEELAKIIADEKILSPDGNELTAPRSFNLMVKTNLGTTDSTLTAENTVYPRAETCQGIYLDYKLILDSLRPKVPFGIAQVGKAFRNEIVARQFIFRTREFEQMEMQYFVHPSEMDTKYEYWHQYRWEWYKDLGIDESKLNWHKHSKLVFYASAAYDIEYSYSCLGGFKEVEGIHARGNYDLTQHQKFSGADLSYFDQVRNEKYLPHIMETSVGLNRLVLMFIDNAYTEEDVNGETRIVLKIDKRLSPVKVAILPLSKKEPLSKTAHELAQILKEHWICEYDETQSIGKRYRRQDEIGTPYCVTVDFETETDHSVTVRDRDTMKQERVLIHDLEAYLKSKLEG